MIISFLLLVNPMLNLVLFWCYTICFFELLRKVTDGGNIQHVGNEVDEDGIYIPAKKTNSQPSVSEPAETENIGAEETEPVETEETEETDSEETEPLETEPSETEPDGNNDNEEFDE